MLILLLLLTLTQACVTYVPSTEEEWNVTQPDFGKIRFFCNVQVPIFECPTQPPNQTTPWLQFLTAIPDTLSLTHALSWDYCFADGFNLVLDKVSLDVDVDPARRQNGSLAVSIENKTIANLTLNEPWPWEFISIPVDGGSWPWATEEVDLVLSFQLDHLVNRTLTRLTVGEIKFMYQ